ncbi:MAG TPA: translocation/assembly module TamB domain-containing protein [Polyangia bacterium]|nr:translocation/assembly module TamB domain-containing protein [Polyangia bacterium]
MKALRVVAAVALGLVALVALAVGGAWALLQTDWGSRTALGLALPRVNAAIAGRLSVDRFTFGGQWLELRGIALRDPAGHPVVEVERLTVAYSLWELIHRRIAIGRLDIARPELDLVQDAEGSNLARALAPRKPHPAADAPKTSSSSGGGLSVAVANLSIADGRVDLRSTDPGARRVHLRSLGVGGSASFDGGKHRAAVDLTIEAEGARIVARGGVDLATRQTLGEGLVVEGSQLDLARLASGLPSSNLAFDLRAHGGGRDLASLDGALDFTAPPNHLDDHTLGPIRLRVRAVRGRYDLAELHASLPGITLDGDGHATPSRLDLHARLVATDLRATTESLAPPHGSPPVALSGSGRVDLALTGPVGAPSLHVAIKAPRLTFGADWVERLSLSAMIPDLRKLEAADVQVGVPRAEIGGRPFRGVEVGAHAGGGRLSAKARIASPYPMRLALAGDWRPSDREVRLRSLDLAYPEARWRLVRPARIAFVDGRLTVEGVALRAAGQRIDLDLVKTDRRLRAKVAVSHLDLGRLPRALVPPSMGLGGRIDLRARIEGTPAAPRVDATASLVDGRVRGYRNLGLDLDAKVAGDRVRGHLSARGLGTSVSASFDAPTSWPPHDRRAPLDLQVTLAETDLGALARALGRASDTPPVAVAGVAALAMRLDGTASDPRLLLQASGRGLAISGERLGNLQLTARGENGRSLSAELTLTDPHSAAQAHLVLDTELGLRDLFQHPPTPEALTHQRITLTGDVDRVPLAQLAKLGGYGPPVAGTLATHFSFSGTARAPTGHLTADVSGASTGRFPPTDARIEVDLDRTAIALRTRVTRKGHPLLAAVGRIDATPGELRDKERLAAAPIQLRAVLGPFQIERLGLPPETDRDPPRAIAGRAHADLTVDGSLRAPRVSGHVQVADIRLDKTPVGYAQISFGYHDRRASVDLLASSSQQGSLHLTGATTIDLGFPAVTRGLDVRDLPLDVRLDAKDFELSGLSGITPEVRTVGGFLAAAIAVRGTPVDPRVSGRLEWTGGKLALIDAGEFRDLHLALHGDEAHLVLDELTARSGAGSLRVTAHGTRAAGHGYELDARADLKALPLYREGQAIAALTLGADVHGTAAPIGTRLTVDVHDTRVELSDAKRKDLEPLSGPKDVIWMKDGKPLNRAQAQKLAVVLAAQKRLEDRGPPVSLGPAAIGEPNHVVTRIVVNAPRKIWVTGKDAYFEIGLLPGFHVAIGDDTRIVGTVEVKRGRVNVFGRRFDLKPGSTVQFAGAPDYPSFDVKAQYQDENDNVTAVVSAEGRIDHLKITVTSPNRPDLSESQLYALIVTGHLNQGGGGSTTASSEAASLLGGVIASSLQKTLAKHLPVDVLTIDSGGGQGLTGTQLEAGRYVTDKLYVGYVGRIGADPALYQNHNAVHVEYQLSSRWSLDGEYGDVGTGSADLMWKKNY